MWVLKYDTNEPLYDTEIDSHREQTGVAEGGGGGMEWEAGLADVSYLYRRDRQSPSAEPRALYSITRGKPQWKRI